MCIYVYTYVCVYIEKLCGKYSMCSVAQSCLTFVIMWTVARHAPLGMEFSRQEYWSGLPFPSLEYTIHTHTHTHTHINIYKRLYILNIYIYYACIELANMIMEPEKFQDLQLAGWRSRRANGINSSWSLSWSLKAGGDWCPSLKTDGGRENSFLLSLFIVFWPSAV